MVETFGRYQLLKKLATGGMGQVFLASQRGPSGFEKILVVKRILPHLSEEDEFIHMFFDEARIAAVLNHPNIAQIYDLGDVDGVFYIAMEYVHGESLRDVNNRANERGEGVPLPLKCRILADAAAGLDYAHRAKSPSGRPLGLIHRDVSPQNVLVGYNGNVKVIDFGIAKAANKMSNTMTGAIKGKYAYMSPEQARGEELDHRSDVFGLGIVFYEVLTSSRLFKRETEMDTMKAVVGAKIAAPSSLVKGIPKSVDAIVLKALARKREDRYQSAGELQLAIEDVLVKLHKPATNAHLAAFMQGLYSDKLAKERIRDEVTNVRAELPSRLNAGSPKTSPSRHDEDTGPSPRWQTNGAKTPRPGKSLPRASDLEVRLRGTSKGDVVAGLFFTSVLAEVSRVLGAEAARETRAAASGKRDYAADADYATSEFLRVLWKAGTLLAPHVGGAEQAFGSLGAASFPELLDKRPTKALAKGSATARTLGAHLVQALTPVVTPGTRSVTDTAARSSGFLFKDDVLPAAFYAGLVRQAYVALAHVEPVVDYEHSGSDRFSLHVRW